MRRVVNVIIVALLPLTLVGVALNQMYLATTSGLAPWKGGGFGMFSSPDRPSHRAVRGFFETEGGLVSVNMYSLRNAATGDQDKAFINARALPNESGLSTWKDVVVSAEWVVEDDVATFTDWSPDADAGMVVRDGDDELTVDAVWVQVWASSYDKSSKIIEPTLVSSYRFEVSP